MFHKYLNKPSRSTFLEEYLITLTPLSTLLPRAHELKHYTHKHQLAGELLDHLSRTKNDKPYTVVSEPTSGWLDYYYSQSQDYSQTTCCAAPLAAPRSPQAASGSLGHLRRRSATVMPPDKGCRLSACIFFLAYLIWPTRLPLPGTQTPLCPSQQRHLRLPTTPTCGFSELSQSWFQKAVFYSSSHFCLAHFWELNFITSLLGFTFIDNTKELSSSFKVVV